MRLKLIAAILLAGTAAPALAHDDHSPAAAAAVATQAAAAPEAPAGATPLADLAVPPESAQRYVLVSTAGEHGRAARWQDADGSLWFRESMNLRGQVFEQDARILAAPGALPTSIVVRGFTPNGDSAESFAIEGGTQRWQSQIDRGEAPASTRALYNVFGGPFLTTAYFTETLLAQPDRRIALLPGGEARMEQLDTATIGTGASSREIQLWAINGVGLSPFPIWMDGDKFYGIVSYVSLLPESGVAEMARLQQLQDEALARRNPMFVERFGGMPAGPVAFENVRLYDSEAASFRDGMTVVADGRLIRAVGPSATTAVPAGARRIDGAGKTLVPGLWDAHMHFGDDAQGPMLLSLGITSARNPGADVTPALAQLNRIATGQLLAPTLFTSVLIDGAGPLAAQGGVVVNSAEETVAAVASAHGSGFRAIKFYSSMRPDWLAAGIAEAHRLGMHVHGHVPATMRALDAVEAGYDEITHINQLMMQALPDDVVNVSNGFARFAGPGRYARNVDLSASPMITLIERLARDRIVTDPTLVAFESSYISDPGELAPAYAPFIGTLPPAIERGARAGGWAPPADLTRADYRASFQKMIDLVGAMHRAGVPIVAGTDGSGMELVHELELYVQSGMSPAQALQTATMRPARLVGADTVTGSITVGKEADMVLVDGDVSTDIGALRRTVWVMHDGRLIDADALREAVGFSGRPR